ncbi:MAG: LysM peptidoglycan-binding domain-containing protein [Pseudomonadota bacterium]
MSLRLILPLTGLVLAGCASTAQISEPVEAPEPIAAPLPERSQVETVDAHLPELQPAESPADYGFEEYAPTNVYERMMNSFALPDCSAHEISRNWAQWYADRPEYMARVLKRAEPWIFFIVDEIERRGMPGELALLPIVESAYDPFAYSSGRALGTWQFVSATGRQYGLDQNWWYDGRRDVYASTHAALDYLEYLHDFFDGDWLLALASYNSGEGRVSRSVKRNLRNGKPGDFWNIKLPRETRGYVPKLLGLTCLFLHAGEYGYTMPETANEPVITTVDFGTQTDLVLVSQHADLPIDQLFTLNPGYNRWATAPEGPYRIVLPLAAAERLHNGDFNVGAQQLMRWDQVTVASGDTLSGLSQRHNVPVSVLRTANQLDSDMIRVGQKLRLPRDERMMADPLYASVAAELAELQSGLLAADRKTHRVRSGESLSVIAKRYRVSVRELQKWNSISNPNRLRVGQQLTVFLSPAPVRSSAPAARNYVVRSGDSLWSIARKHKIKLDDLMKWNGLNSASVLQPGQSLKVRL